MWIFVTKMTEVLSPWQVKKEILISFLLEKVPNADLCDKIEKGNWNCVKETTSRLQNRKQAKASDDYCLTPLILSCNRKNTRILQVVIKHNTDINAQIDEDGSA